ncbi:MAG TPA: hypothetical protein VFR97_13410 [Capillimicrobium sp.]|nr:hypothetical protein [Capillimicrobium sp.]
MSDRDTEAIGAAIRRAAARVEAPRSLRAGLERSPSRRRGAVTAAAVAALAVAFAAAGTAVIVLDDDGPPPTPRAVQAPVRAAAAQALAPTTAPAPAPDPHDPRLLDARAGRLAFPDSPVLAEVGRRDGVVAGRSAATVRYASRGRWVGYTIVAGPPLPAPADGRRVTGAGITATALRHDGAAVVVWTRANQTCLVASWDFGERALLRLAAAWS